LTSALVVVAGLAAPLTQATQFAAIERKRIRGALDASCLLLVVGGLVLGLWDREQASGLVYGAGCVLTAVLWRRLEPTRPYAVR